MNRVFVRILPIVAAILAFGLLLAPFPSSRELGSDLEVQGSVVVRNRPANVGATIEAYASGTLLADTTVQMAGFYTLRIPPDDPVTLDRDGWLEGDEIRFVVDGETASPSMTATGGSHQLDISVQFISDVKKSTWGKIKALFR
jgi:hypothetical protein